MQIIFLGTIQFYSKTVDKINQAVDLVIGDARQKYNFDLVFVWSEEEDEIFWDIYDDMIKIGMPLSTHPGIDLIKNKLTRVLDHKQALKSPQAD